MSGQVSDPLASAWTEEAADGGEQVLQLGQRVTHAKFGEGVVLNYEGGRHARVQVNFEHAGIKWLVLEYAHLQVS